MEWPPAEKTSALPCLTLGTFRVRKDRGSESVVNTPAISLDAITNGNRGKSLPFCPFVQRQGNTLELNDQHARAVASVLLVRHPPAVTLFVVAIVIHPVNHVLFARRRSHVFEECREGFAPSLAHFYTSPAVAVIVFVPGVLATGNHAQPVDMKATIAHAMLVIPSSYL